MENSFHITKQRGSRRFASGGSWRYEKEKIYGKFRGLRGPVGFDLRCPVLFEMPF